MDTLEKKNVEQIGSSNDLEPKEDIHIPKEIVPFQFSFQERMKRMSLIFHTNMITAIKYLTKSLNGRST